MKQVLRQRLQQKLTPQQILLMKLIQLPTQDLEMRLKREIEENPVLSRCYAFNESTMHFYVNDKETLFLTRRISHFAGSVVIR